MCIGADKTQPSIPSLEVQLSEATKPIPIPGKDNRLLSPTSPEEPFYVNIIPSDDGDLSPSPRARAHGFSESPKRKRQDWFFQRPQREICSLSTDPQCDLYESIDGVYSPPVSESHRAVPCSLPISSQDQEQRQVDHYHSTHSYINTLPEYVAKVSHVFLHSNQQVKSAIAISCWTLPFIT